MKRILTNTERDAYPNLFDQMFRARAEVFHKRLRWNVVVRNGWEIDHYDEAEDPVYLLTMEASEVISGSLRLLPTIGPTMLSNEFASFFNEPIDVESPTVWECTRFCVHPTDPGCETRRQTSARLLIGLCELCLSSGVEQIVGVYENCMSRVYGRIGWIPTPLATTCLSNLKVGIWDVSEQALNDMRDRLARSQSNGKVLAA